jgi:ElaB/YqjD/DUF883 family membrane-anchored ribosome-binding protein
METLDKAFDSAHEAVEKISSATQHAAEALSEKGEQMKQAEEQMLDNCRRYIRDNPLTSLGIATAAGFLLSRLLSGR